MSLFVYELIRLMVSQVTRRPGVLGPRSSVLRHSLLQQLQYLRHTDQLEILGYHRLAFVVEAVLDDQ